MQRSHRRAQSVQYAPSKRIYTPRITHSPRLPTSHSLRKLPSLSSPVSFQRLLQVKFRTTQAPALANDTPQETTSDCTTTNGTSESETPNSESEPTSKSNHWKFGVLSSSLPSTLLPVDSGSDSEDAMCKYQFIMYELEVDGILPAIGSQREASIRLAAADARKKVVRAEHRLALSIAKEHVILGQLYQELAEQVGRQTTVADLGMQHVRHSIQKRGFEVEPAASASSRESVAVSPTKKQKLPNKVREPTTTSVPLVCEFTIDLDVYLITVNSSLSSLGRLAIGVEMSHQSITPPYLFKLLLCSWYYVSMATNLISCATTVYCVVCVPGYCRHSNHGVIGPLA